MAGKPSKRSNRNAGNRTARPVVPPKRAKRTVTQAQPRPIRLWACWPVGDVMRRWRPKPCRRCGEPFTPNSGRQTACATCGPIIRREYARTYGTTVRKARTGRSDGATPRTRPTYTVRADFLLALRAIAHEYGRRCA